VESGVGVLTPVGVGAPTPVGVGAGGAGVCVCVWGGSNYHLHCGSAFEVRDAEGGQQGWDQGDGHGAIGCVSSHV
jgi:hypothetical protein